MVPWAELCISWSQAQFSECMGLGSLYVPAPQLYCPPRWRLLLSPDLNVSYTPTRICPSITASAMTVKSVIRGRRTGVARGCYAGRQASPARSVQSLSQSPLVRILGECKSRVELTSSKAGSNDKTSAVVTSETKARSSRHANVC